MSVLAWITIAGGFAWLAIDGGAQGPPPGRATPVAIDVVVANDSEALVTEKYRLPADSAGLQLQLLRRPCALVGPVVAIRGTDRVTLAGEARGPWTILHEGTLAGASEFELQYPVTIRGPIPDIPLIHARRAVPRGDADREGGVTLSVSTRGDVRFPRVSRAARDAPWTGRFVAIPSFVRIEHGPSSGSAGAPCAGVAEGASDGGLTWRFWTLVGIMAAWVPLYLAWARREPGGAEG